jgi:hypothetical protein
MSFEAPIQSIDVLSAKVTNRDEHSFVAQVDMREFYANGLSISTNIHN